MVGVPPRKPTPPPPGGPAEARGGGTADPREPDKGPAGGEDGGIGEFVRRGLWSALEVASRSKDDILRIAAGEIRSWLDHMDLDRELQKALSRMKVEVKAEITFSEREDGKLQPSAKTDVQITRPVPDEPVKE